MGKRVVNEVHTGAERSVGASIGSISTQQQASEANGLGLAVMNLEQNEIVCLLEFVNSDGSMESNVELEMGPLASIVDLFTNAVSDGFVGSAAFICDESVMVVSVNLVFPNGAFPTYRITFKGAGLVVICWIGGEHLRRIIPRYVSAGKIEPQC